MTLLDAKITVVMAGKKLVESGLIARTWGNVSCRIDDTHFVITPSGREYMSLTPDDIVEVTIPDCSYEGEIKPSSEKKVHAAVYRQFPDANFVIHTHQDHASSISVLPVPFIEVADIYSLLDQKVICASYGLPGTKKLTKGVSTALTQSTGKAVIMKHHGVVCFGKDYEEAFQVANELEAASNDYIHNLYETQSKQPFTSHLDLGLFAMNKNNPSRIPKVLESDSKRTPAGFELHYMDKVYSFRPAQWEVTTKDLQILETARLHWKVYEKNPQIQYIVHSTEPGTMAVSTAGMKVRPLLDDFAQIAGTSIPTVAAESDFGTFLQKRSLLFIKNQGALCCAATKSDAQAVKMVAEKNSNALIAASLYGEVKYINPFESSLMRFVYLKKYSKEASK